MCGFVTIVTGDHKTVNTRILHNMTTRVAHRGPDDFGYAWIDPLSGTSRTWTSQAPPHDEVSGVLFGHRRLSILDLTPGGHQPMFSDDGSIVLSFNGEIYNFVELKAELEARGVRFRSRCDTEVLLRAYEYWGEDAFNKFNGMWAFTLWDARNRKLVASRDRFGVKPLYYTVVDGTWIFASEIKAILAYPGAFRGFDEQNVLEFLTSSLIDDDETTLFREIRSVPPSTYLILRDQQLTLRKFWTLRVDSPREKLPDRSLIEEFRSLLNDSVRLRLRSDVPIGTMLSGGLDSTSITALIREQSKRTDVGDSGLETEALQNFHHTFSACWPGWQNNEEAEIDFLCAKFDLLSHKVYPTGELLADLLPKVMYFLEEPFETPTALVQFLLMREAKEHGVKVVLNGHGSDETLAGYPGFFVPPFLASLLLSGQPLKYLREHRAFRPSREWKNRRVPEELLRALVPASLRPRIDELLYAGEQQRITGGIFSAVKTPPMSRQAGVNTEASQDLSLLNSVLWLKFTEKILPMWLRMEDRVSMAWSVESRLPFMDYRLVEFAFNLSDDLKLKDGYTKYILRQAVQDILPERIVFNRVKQRFATPYGRWFRGAWRPMIEDLFAGSCAVQPYLDLPLFREKLQAYLAGNNAALDTNVLWRVINTEICLKTFSESKAAA